MFVNPTKTTLPSIHISISYNNEKDFIAISKIIQLFQIMKINLTFEIIEIAGKNYLKNIIYGITEDNLLRLKKTHLLLHTPFDYSFFKKNEHILVEKYLNIALQNLFIKTFNFLETKKTKQNLFQTFFFSKNNKYISNIKDYNLYKVAKYYNNYKFLNKSDFYQSFGAKYSIFAINNIDNKILTNVAIEILKYLNLNDQVSILEKFINTDINKVIEFFKKNTVKNFSAVKIENINTLPQLIWNNNEKTKLPTKLTKIKTKLKGKYKINEIVEAIKNENIKIPKEYQLYQILDDKIEYFPNINFWNETIINPIIILKKNEYKTKIW